MLAVELNDLSLEQHSAGLLDPDSLAELKAQAMAKQSALDLECTELRKRVSARDDEVARLQDTIEDQAASIDNLNVSDPRQKPDWEQTARFLTNPSVSQRMLASAASQEDGGKEFAKAVQELEKSRRATESQVVEFEQMRQNLMRDLTDRCEKVVELQMQVDEWKERHRALLKATNSKAHNKRIQVLEYNLSQLTELERAVSIYILESDSASNIYCSGSIRIRRSRKS